MPTPGIRRSQRCRQRMTPRTRARKSQAAAGPAAGARPAPAGRIGISLPQERSQAGLRPQGCGTAAQRGHGDRSGGSRGTGEQPCEHASQRGGGQHDQPGGRRQPGRHRDGPGEMAEAGQLAEHATDRRKQQSDLHQEPALCSSLCQRTAVPPTARASAYVGNNGRMVYAHAVPTVLLSGDVEMPIVGFGTWRLRVRPACEPVRFALDTGYRHIDTATMYGNKAEIGRALRDSRTRDARHEGSRATIEPVPHPSFSSDDACGRYRSMRSFTHALGGDGSPITRSPARRRSCRGAARACLPAEPLDQAQQRPVRHRRSGRAVPQGHEHVLSRPRSYPEHRAGPPVSGVAVPWLPDNTWRSKAFEEGEELVWWLVAAGWHVRWGGAVQRLFLQLEVGVGVDLRGADVLVAEP